jgi:hypothetical protein
MGEGWCGGCMAYWLQKALVLVMVTFVPVPGI